MTFIDIQSKLKIINKVFDTRDVVSIKITENYIQKYYKVNRIPYSFFHAKSDLIYMGISRDGVYKKDDLLAAARLIEENIRGLGAKRVLELAAGRGANSFYLSKIFPHAKFGVLIFPWVN